MKAEHVPWEDFPPFYTRTCKWGCDECFEGGKCGVTDALYPYWWEEYAAELNEAYNRYLEAHME